MTRNGISIQIHIPCFIPSQGRRHQRQREGLRFDSVMQDMIRLREGDALNGCSANWWLNSFRTFAQENE
jgi:hypothetical protein